MTIQEYKEKIIHTIEQMEMEHKVSVNKFEVEKFIGYDKGERKEEFGVKIYIS